MRVVEPPMEPWASLPIEVIEWARAAFSECNRESTAAISQAPNLPEPALDQGWIASLAKYAVPRVVGPGWIVRIDTHFLGGGHHFGSWEVADIGIIVRLRDPSGTWVRKVALLQSKRLYPTRGTVRQETQSDYLIGFARLDDPEDELLSLAKRRTYSFTHRSRYRELVRGSHQVGAIQAYEREAGLKVYYHLYNPWQVPFSQRVPVSEYVRREGLPELGIRVVPAALMHDLLGSISRAEPSLGDLLDTIELPPFGWRLEAFVADELLTCREGDSVPDRNDVRLRRLFGERTGPIAAAIAMTLEAPESFRAG